jgi:energy-coupling factor transporter ATP-binding protein EcfA2
MDAALLPGFARQYQGVRDVVADPDDLAKLIRTVVGLEAREGVDLVENPFKGLFAFETKDTHLYFGREQEAEDLLQRLKQNPMVVVVGDSGSGKSSLVKAGLIPRYLGGGLARDVLEMRYDHPWFVVETRPRSSPFGSLADDLEDAVADLGIAAGDILEIKRHVREHKTGEAVYDAIRRVTPQNAEILFFCDQFEELFTSAEESDRQAYINLLLQLQQQSKTKIRIVIAIRRDYVNLCSQYDAFSDVIRESKYTVHRMQDAQLLDCVFKPLGFTAVGDDSVFARNVVADVGDQPGDLALMQLAVTRAWQQRKYYNSLTEAYNAAGGVSGALANHAEQVYQQTLSEDDRKLAEPLFIRLVRLGDTGGGNPPHRRPERTVNAGMAHSATTGNGGLRPAAGHRGRRRIF